LCFMIIRTNEQLQVKVEQNLHVFRQQRELLLLCLFIVFITIPHDLRQLKRKFLIKFYFMFPKLANRKNKMKEELEEREKKKSTKVPEIMYFNVILSGFF
jgi:hypothetical protein